MSQLADFVRARKLFAYGEVRDYWDHSNCVGYVKEVVSVIDANRY
jgi:alpha-amylase